MIIKSMSRKSPSFGQLIEYFHKEHYSGAPSFFHNLYSGGASTDQIREEFEENATFLPKRKNGNYLYHEVITLEKDLPVSEEHQARMLLDLVERYISLRAPRQMVYGKMHRETGHLHFHLLISANGVRGRQRIWLKKSELGKIQRQMEAYKIERYPELGLDRYYDPAGRKLRREKERRQEQEKITSREYEYKKRSGKKSQKQQDREILHEIFEASMSEDALTEKLRSAGFERYLRGNTEGVLKLDTGRKYRLRTLGLSKSMQSMKTRGRVFAEREAELLLRRGGTYHRSRDEDRER